MKVFKNFNLGLYNSYRINAMCSIAFFPEKEEDIQSVFKNKSKNILILGNGNNVILSREFYDQSFIIFSNNFNEIEIKENIIKAEAGATLTQLSKLALENKLSGMEIFYDIPSSVGGAVIMNAGASGEEIKDVLIKVRYYDPINDCFNEINKEDIHFDYRSSYFQKNPHLVVTKAWLQLSNGDEKLIKNKMQALKEARLLKQPRDFPNAGSVFKRPKGVYVGAIIEELGLKGYRLGGAMISEKHAGFIINYDKASGSEIIDLIKHIKKIIKEKKGLELEVEQRIV